MVGFNRWRSIPESGHIEDIIRGSKFERRLLVLVQGVLHKSFGPLRDIHYDALAIK